MLLLLLLFVRLKAFPVDDGRSGLVVLLFGNPHLLEGGEGGQDGATDPDGVFALGRSDDLDLHGGWSQGGDLLLHAVGDARVHGGASRQNGVGVQILTDVDVALHDRVVDGFVDTARFHTQEGGLEEGLRATESLVTNGDDLCKDRDGYSCVRDRSREAKDRFIPDRRAIHRISQGRWRQRRWPFPARSPKRRSTISP